MQSRSCSSGSPVNHFDWVLQIDILPDLDDSHEDGSHDQNYTASTMDYLAAAMKTVLIKSPTLSTDSPFVNKYFSKDTSLLHQQHRILHIQASDENFKDLYRFVNDYTLPKNRPSALLSLLNAAIKFKASAYVDYCSSSLQHLPMTYETALLYLDHPLALIIPDKFEPFIDRARLFIARKFKTLSMSKVKEMPLAGFKAFLLSDLLKVQSEDEVYDFMMEWAHIQYPKLEVRRAVLSNSLLDLIRPQYMSIRKLDLVKKCPVLGEKLAEKFACNAIMVFKVGDQDKVVKERQYLITNSPSGFWPISNITETIFECLVYLNLLREECSSLSTRSHILSEGFNYGGINFNLFAYCSLLESRNYFGLFLCVQNREDSPAAYRIDYDFELLEPSGYFVTKYNESFTWTGQEAVGAGNTRQYYHSKLGRFAVGHRNPFGVPWTEFIAKDSPYFIDGVLHLRVQIKVSNV